MRGARASLSSGLPFGTAGWRRRPNPLSGLESSATRPGRQSPGGLIYASPMPSKVHFGERRLPVPPAATGLAETGEGQLSQFFQCNRGARQAAPEKNFWLQFSWIRERSHGASRPPAPHPEFDLRQTSERRNPQAGHVAIYKEGAPSCRFC
jgi:hypothetical protein